MSAAAGGGVLAVMELLNTGDSVGGIKAEAHALVHGAGGPREVQGARILARCDELEASLAEARAAVAELTEAAKELRKRQRAYLADPEGQRCESKGRAVGIAAARLDTALSNIEGGT